MFVQCYNKLKETLKYRSRQLYTGGSHRRIIACFMEFMKFNPYPYPPSRYLYFPTYKSPEVLLAATSFVRHEAPSEREMLLAEVAEVLLAEVAIQLYSGNTCLFYDMLTVMKLKIRDAKVCKLATEVEAKINSYIPRMLHGESVRMCTCSWDDKNFKVRVRESYALT